MGMPLLMLLVLHAGPNLGSCDGLCGTTIVCQSGPVDGCPELTWTACYDPETGFYSSNIPSCGGGGTEQIIDCAHGTAQVVVRDQKGIRQKTISYC